MENFDLQTGMANIKVVGVRKLKKKSQLLLKFIYSLTRK